MAKQRPKRIREPHTSYNVSRVKRERLAARFRREEGSTAADWGWLQVHWAELEREFAGRWIAVGDSRVVGTGVRLSTAMKQAAKRGHDHPLVVAFKSAKYRDAVEVAEWF